MKPDDINTIEGRERYIRHTIGGQAAEAINIAARMKGFLEVLEKYIQDIKGKKTTAAAKAKASE